MKKIYALIILALFGQSAIAQNQAPVISNINALADTVFHRLRVYYDVSDAENDPVEVVMVASADGGQTFCLNTDTVSGDIGPNVSVGTGKYFEWDYPDSLSEMVTDLRIRLTANDWKGVNLQALVDQVDSVSMRENLSYIEGIRHRNTGPAHLQEVQDSLLGAFAYYGLETRTFEFPYGNYTGVDLIGKKAGSLNPCRTLIIDGHYDTVDDSPGADDNGSSQVGMLEIMRIIQGLDLGYSVEFISFDLEEAGLEGSAQFVADGGILEDEHVAAVFNMDMIAYFSNIPNSQIIPEGFDWAFPELYQQVVDNEFRANFIISTANYFSDTLMYLFESTAADLVPDLLVGSVRVPDNGELIPDTRRSDHVAFWDAGYMALHISDGAETRNPNYHDPTDVIDSCNFTFASNVTKAVLATVVKLAKPMRGNVEESAVITDPTSGIAFIGNNDLHVSVSPNPSSGVFQLLTNAVVDQVMVHDLTGRLVIDQTSKTIDLGKMKAGVYTATVISEGRKAVLRLVKND